MDTATCAYFSTCRYKLPSTAADDTVQANFFCYDEIARQIVCRNCEALINPLRKPTGFPPTLKAAIS